MRLAVALCAVLGVGPSFPVRAEGVRLSGRIEAGAEYDSNAGRVEHVDGEPSPQPIVGSPLGRLVLTGDLGVPIGDRQSFVLSGAVGGKHFTRAQNEDVVVADADAGWSLRAAERTTLGLTGSYYESFQHPSIDARDFRSLVPGARLGQGVGEGGAITVGAGYRWLTYWPDRDFDFTGPTAFLGYRHQFPGDAGAADWELAAGTSAELRAFAGNRCTPDVCPGPDGAGARRDQFLTFHLAVTRTGSFLAGGGIAGQANLSNSFGERLLRGLVHLRAVALLPADLSLSARAEFVVAHYFDRLPLLRDVTTLETTVGLEDESRSTVRAELVRPLGAHVDLGLRYTIYTNELGATQVHYLRQTALLFVAVSAER